MSKDKTWYGDDADEVLRRTLDESDLLDPVPGVDDQGAFGEGSKVALDPFSIALADHISGKNPELDDAVEGELDSLLSDDEPDVVHNAEGVIGIDPTNVD